MLAVYFLLFFKTAWVCDDAYINFRSLDQLYEGKGPIWNPHERVQVYTSPLWYWLLASVSWIFCKDYFIASICVSFAIFVLLSRVFAKRAESRLTISALILLAIGSRFFYDYSTSGLENILCSFITLLTLVQLFRFSHANQASGDSDRYYINTLVIFSIAPLCRHDLTTLLILPILAMIYKAHNRSRKRRIADICLTAVPLLIWTIFSILYYGVPFPNTAYAKLYTGISAFDLIKQGFNYIKVTLSFDPVMIITIAGMLILAFRHGNFFIKAVATGIITNILYVIYVGGDFMAGRFLVSAFIASVLLILELQVMKRLRRFSKPIKLCIVGGALLYLAFFPYTTLNIPYEMPAHDIKAVKANHGIADERCYYFETNSLMAWLGYITSCNSEEKMIFPNTPFSWVGYNIKNNPDLELPQAEIIGMFGYHLGTKKIILDRLALPDPFLARHPVINTKKFRIGHFYRIISDDYAETVNTGKNCLKDTKDAHLYDLIVLATQSKDYFSLERLKAIWLLNTNQW